MAFSNTSVFDDAFGYGGNPDTYYTPPPDWQAALETTAPGITAVATQQTVTPTQDWITTFARAVTAVQMADSQRQLINLQLQRAREGKPPLDASAYTPGVSIGLSPPLQKGLMWGGAILLFWLVTK